MTVLNFPNDRVPSSEVPALSSGDLLTLAEVMELLRVGKTKLYALMGAGKLRSFKVGKGRMFTRVEIARFIAAEERAGLPKRKRRSRRVAR